MRELGDMGINGSIVIVRYNWRHIQTEMGSHANNRRECARTVN